MRLLLTFLIAVCAVGARADRYHPAEPRGRAAVNLDENDPQYWANEARASIERHAKRLAPSGKARNVVMFLGDGMSIATMSAARTLLGQRQNKPGEETEMFFESFPTVGLSKTYCVDVQVADSACTSTAYLCGVKTNEGMLGLNAGVPRFDCVGGRDEANYVSSIAEWALADGRDTGFVTTTRVTHASPAGLYGKSADRDWETDEDIEKSGFNATTCPDLTQQLVNMHPGNKFKVILGGGRRTFVPTTQNDDGGVPGFRTDGRNLIEEWQQDKRERGVSFNYVANRTQLMAVNENLPEYLLGLFESSHLSYHVEAEGTDEPTLAELTATAINMLSRNEKGFFLFVEGGRIDHAHHDNFVLQALDETLEMDKAVAVAAEMLDEEDSLIVVTADHAHVMAFNGYQRRGQDILGVARLDRDGVPFMTLSYTNGPGFRSHEPTGVRPDVTAEESFGENRWRSHVDAPRDSETHGGDDVAVFAWGTYHSLFTGLYEQSQIPYRMAYAACIGPGLHSCNGAGRVLQAPLALTLLALVAMLFAQRS